MNTIESRHLLKIQQDPFYGSAYAVVQSLELIKRAGFFDDELVEPVCTTQQFDAGWFTTPVEKIINHLRLQESKEKRLVVLLTTGSFCPIHKSHIEMMELAKKELEQLGYAVLGGYLSPSHDSYVSVKCKQQTLSASHRVRLCEEVTALSDWLMTDSWEALHTTKAINFTDVIRRLEQYLARHLTSDKPVEIFYVFGSDNAEFAYAFIGHGRCVCVKRPGFENHFSALKINPLIADNPHIILSGGSTDTAAYASSKVRLGDDTALTEDVKKIFRTWRTKQNSLRAIKKATYYLRNEGSWSYSCWQRGRNKSLLDNAWNEFLVELSTLLRKQFLKSQCPDDPLDLEIQFLNLTKQYEQAGTLTAGKKVLSLDPCIEGYRNIGVSRCFLSGVGKHYPQLVARPGCESLEKQILSLPAGSYVLLDDDIATGTTIKKVMALLPPHIEIKQVVTLVKLADSPVDRPEVIDVSDCRDFLAGSNEAGLVVKLPNGRLARAPYMLPYVFPSDRAATPLSLDRHISYELWRINRNFFQKIQPSILLNETNPAFQELMFYLGFNKSDSMQSLCQWHMDRVLR
jgi:nicotinic acid mononucleotide adenylyltransferase